MSFSYAQFEQSSKLLRTASLIGGKPSSKDDKYHMLIFKRYLV
jgi:hypothetical protein